MDTITLPSGNYLISLADAGTGSATGEYEDANVSGDLDITDDLEVNGAGSGVTTINGNGTYRIFDVVGTDLAPVSLTVRDVAVRESNGVALSFDGAGTLSIERSLFTRNVHLENHGAAVYTSSMSATLSVDESVFTENCSAVGSAINGLGNWTISNTTFADNGNASLLGLSVSECWSVYGTFGTGGGALWQQAAAATITNSTFKDNRATIGGAIHVSSGTLDVINSTLTGNEAVGGNIHGDCQWGMCGMGVGGDGGGAIYVAGIVPTVTVKNSTIVNNVTNGPGGGIDSLHDGEGEVQTVLTIENSIIANNTSGEHPDITTTPPTLLGADCWADNVMMGDALLGDADGCSAVGGSGTVLTGDPGIDVYTDDATPGNGHYPLLETSQAIDAGDNVACPATDQIGTTRPKNGDWSGDASCDLGAIEFDPPIPELSAVADNQMIAEDQVLVISKAVLLANDLLGAEPTTISIFQMPANGTLTDTPDYYIYDSNQDYNGSDNFVYKLVDSVGQEQTTTVSITVTPVNDIPDAVGDAAETTKGSAITINVLSNDSIGDGLASLTVVGGPALGNQVIVDTNNDIVYIPSQNYVGNDTVTYKIQDTDGEVDFATVDITVSEPVSLLAVSDTDTVGLGVNYIQVLDNDTVGSNTSVVSVTQAANATTWPNGTNVGFFSMTPGDFTFDYTIQDGTNTSTASVTVTVQ